MTEPAKTLLTELCGPHCGATNYDGSKHLTVGHCEPCHLKTPLRANGRHGVGGGNGHYRGPIPKVG